MPKIVNWGGDILPPSSPYEVKRVLEKLIPNLIGHLGIEHLTSFEIECNRVPGRPSIHVEMKIYAENKYENTPEGS